MKHLIILLCLWFFCFQSIRAQKQLSRTYDAQNIEQILIDANGVHLLTVTTAKINTISVAVALEGETSEEIVIKDLLKDTSLTLGFGAWPFAKQYHDKLSAHKIVSVEVTLQIPENLFVSITSNTAKVFTNGSFDMLYVTIEDEPCMLKNFNGNANLKTNRGAISVNTNNNVTKAIARTAHGTLSNKLQKEGRFTIWAESIHGDIRLQQTQ